MAINKVVYGNNTLIDLTGDTVTANKIVSGYKAHDKSGASITGSIPNRGAKTISISNLNDATEEANGAYYNYLMVSLDSSEKAKIVPENIKEGVSILGVDGSYSGGSDSFQLMNFTSQQNYYPDNQNLNIMYEVQRNAIELYNAGRGNWITWDYQDGNNPLKLKVTNASKGCVIDCSGFVGMIMRGYGFFDSIYYSKRTTANATCTPNDTHKSGDTYQWDWDYQQHNEQLVYGSDSSLKLGNNWRVITAADMAAYFAYNCRLFKASEHTPKQGDIAFFTKPNDRFLDVSHVGLMLSPNYYLNATDTGTTEGVIVTKSASRPPEYYARPNYYNWNQVNATSLDSTVNLFPKVYYNMKSSGSGGGVTYTCSNTGKITFSGTRTSASTYSLISPWCPLVLPAGTYRLSGFVNGTGTNTTSATHSYWGMRVYGTTDLTVVGSGHSGIAGTTKSSNGANSSSRTPCWDLGGGCEFTLTQTTAISIDLYCGRNNTNYSKISVQPSLVKIA